MKVEPTKEHQWLKQLEGEWTFEAEADAGPGQPPHTSRGGEIVRALGPIWVVAEGWGEMPGGGIGENRMTLGYDPQKGRFVGTWVGSMMTWMWVYEGALDASGRVLTLDTEGPDMFGEGGGAIRYQDVIELVDPDTRRLRSRAQTADGGWREFMTATYRRKAETMAPAKLVRPDT